jgi:CubicO group peptidase (beta-lactamase class C family)
MRQYWQILFIACVLLLPACKLVITVPPGGSVTTESGNITCPPHTRCVVDIVDDLFDETFTVQLEDGYYFAGWKNVEGYLCAGWQAPCRLFTTFFGASEALMALLDDDTEYHLEARIVPVRDFDFSGLDRRLQRFVEESEFEGASILIVDKDLGVIHEHAFGSYDLDTVVALASASKLPSATLLMALDSRKHFNFDIAAPIGQYLPYEGQYGDVTTEQLLSNTSGIPGIKHVSDYGPHLCQYMANETFRECGREIYQHLLPVVHPPGTIYSYGGSQWQLAGLVAEHAGGARWASLFDKFIASPCDLEVFEYGNMLGRVEEWDGEPSGLFGQNNPNIEAGAISNLRDYGKILMLHLNDGWCGPHRVLASGAVEFMRVNRKGPVLTPEEDYGNGYGMGWFIRTWGLDTGEYEIYWNPGGLGTHTWLDIRRDYGVVFLVQDNSQEFVSDAGALVHEELFDLISGIIDDARIYSGLY